MTEEILQSILSAEAQANAEKTRATQQAEGILAEAETTAQKIEQKSLNACKAFLEAEQAAAKSVAQKQYEETILSKTKEAKEYCAETLKNSENLVSEIVRRIVSGDC
ncbi:MAG: hypothetical protein IKA72_01680 [Clostridia bacterium]|nr:hypothetical protein [Clostridia bacterium]